MVSLTIKRQNIAIVSVGIFIPEEAPQSKFLFYFSFENVLAIIQQINQTLSLTTETHNDLFTDL